jgi:RHS repeat-associated protein
MSAISGVTSAHFAYDAAGRRTQKTIGSETTEFLYDDDNIVQERDLAGEPTANDLAGLNVDDIYARSDTSGTSALLTNNLGSTIGLVNAKHSIATAYAYSPTGQADVTGLPSGNSFEFAGREDDSDGFGFNRSRYLDFSVGRFTSADSTINDPEVTQNPYVYAADDSVNLTDPFGNNPFDRLSQLFHDFTSYLSQHWQEIGLGLAYVAAVACAASVACGVALFGVAESIAPLLAPTAVSILLAAGITFAGSEGSPSYEAFDGLTDAIEHVLQDQGAETAREIAREIALRCSERECPF